MEQTITLDDILTMEKRLRATFINCLSGFKSGNLVGTIDSNGVYNLSIFNSIVHIGANPPYLGMISRPLTVPRHTYENLKATGYYTLNLIDKNIYQAAHQTSAKYDESVSEFEACGLTPEVFEPIHAPYVKESPVKFGMQYVEEHHIKANDTLLIIGKVLEIRLPEGVMESALQADGFVDLANLDIIAITGLDAYYEATLLARLGYARPGEAPRIIS